MHRRVMPLDLRGYLALIASRRRTCPNGHIRGILGRYADIGGQEVESGWRTLMLRKEGIEGVAQFVATNRGFRRARHAVLLSARYPRQI